MKIELRPIDSLIPYIKNPRKNEKAIPKVKASLQEFGFRQPIVVDTKNVIVVGHTRWLAAKQLGLTEVPVHVADSLTPSQIQAYRLTDNRTNQEAEWDDELLKIELSELKSSAFNLELTGFDSKEIDQLLKDSIQSSTTEEYSTSLSQAEELQEKWLVQEGQIWQCGVHRIVCGDCADSLLMQRLIEKEVIDLLLTDPPYGVKRDKGFGGADAFGGGSGKSIARRKYTDDWDAERPTKATFDYLLSLAKASILWGGNYFADLLPMSTHWLVWDKHQTMPTFGDCELAWTSIDRKSVKQYDIEYNGLIGKEKERFHPTQKPLKLFEALIVDYTSPQALILDAYGGSGTTLISAQQQGRRARLVERSPAYVAVTLERYANLTQDVPRLI